MSNNDQDWPQLLLGSDAFRQAVAEARQRSQREEALQEVAAWFGQTGLDEEDERELPRYLRREYGEDIFSDPNALKAADLVYLGKVMASDGSECHYWQVPGHVLSYATIERYPDGGLYFSCDAEAPPAHLMPPAQNP